MKDKYKLPYEVPLLDACLRGQATISSIDDYIEYWHQRETGHTLYEALGLSLYAYTLFRQHGNIILEEALACRRMDVDFDNIWLSEKVPRLLEICQKIKKLKADLHNQTRLSNATTFTKLEELGEQIHKKNEITGLTEDIQYLHVSNGEYLHYIAGFIGDEAHVQDADGRALCIGDTVADSGCWERMIILLWDGTPALDQNYLSERDAIRKKTFNELDISTARCAGFSVTLNSCLDRYCQQSSGQTVSAEIGGPTVG